MPTCTPAALADAAKTFQGLSPGQKQAIDTYLLAVIAGGSTDPNTLALAAKDFQGIPSGMFKRVQAYLLCQIASGGGGSSQDMQVAWTPTNVQLGQLIGFSAYNNPSLAGITSLTFNQASLAEAVEIDYASALVSIAFPNLVSSPNGLAVTNNSLLTSVSLPLLQSVGTNSMTFAQNVKLPTISLPALTTTSSLNANGCTLLTSFSAPLVTSGDMHVSNCPALTSVVLSAWLPNDLQVVTFTGDALSAASVNLILHRCVLQPTFGTSNETVELDGGTSAAPSGQGIADKATLILRGATVNTN